MVMGVECGKNGSLSKTYKLRGRKSFVEPLFYFQLHPSNSALCNVHFKTVLFVSKYTCIKENVKERIC